MNKRFDEAIKNAEFKVLEIAGFAKQPILALKAGMAIGYKMACDDIEIKLKHIKMKLNNESSTNRQKSKHTI